MIVDATNIKIFAGNDKIAKITSGTLSYSADERDQSNNDGNKWRSRDYGLLSATMSGSSFFEFDAGYGYEDLRAKMFAREKVTLTWNAGEVGDMEYTQSFIITQLEKSGSTGEDLTYDYSFSSDGEPTVTPIAAG